MQESKNKARLISLLRSNRQAFDALIDQIPREHMTAALAPGEWSVKDNISHITHYESWIAERLHEHLVSRVHIPTEMDGMPWQKVNEIVYQQHKDDPLEVVLDESRRSFARLIETVEALPEAFLIEPQSFEGVPNPVVVWDILQEDVYEHYLEHIDDIRNKLFPTA